jgi:pimeloyl-ACP methyl ester carboxylesterase
VTSAPPLLLLHGLHGSAGDWSAITAQFPAERLVIDPDLPGFGGSARLTEHTLSAVVARLAERVGEAAGDSRVDIVGHGWGGTIALAFAAHHPASVRRLVDISGAWPPWLAAGPEHAAPGMKRSAQLAWALAGNVPQRQLRQDYLTEDSGLSGAPIPERSLVIWGANDRRLRPRYGEKVVSALGRYVDPTTVEMVTVPGAGHAPHLSAPGVVGSVLCEFLQP